jgi:putative methyltransferase (TIGR04325 family)
MKRKIIENIREIFPPVALRLYQNLSQKRVFTGNYKTWEEARKASGGYDSDVILNKVKDSLLKVKNGEAVYERDSVLFDEVQYSWPLLAGLLWVASRENNSLNMIDFGGSLGSTYYQNIKFLSHLKELKWSIIEQKRFVECGKRYFENDHLRFYRDLNECIGERSPNAVLFSSVLQYLEKPYDFLAEVLDNKFKYILVDRTSFLEKGEDRITVQKVPPEIYPASYPAWFFDLAKFLNFFSKDYDLLADFDSFESFRVGNAFAQNKGFIFSRRTSHNFI